MFALVAILLLLIENSAKLSMPSSVTLVTITLALVELYIYLALIADWKLRRDGQYSD